MLTPLIQSAPRRRFSVARPASRRCLGAVLLLAALALTALPAVAMAQETASTQGGEPSAAEETYETLERWLPEVFFAAETMGIELWQWAGLALLVVFAWLASWLVARAMLLLLQPLSRRTLTSLDDRLLENGAPPLRFTVALGLFSLGLAFLRLEDTADTFFVDAVQVLLVLSIVWFAVRLVDILSEWARDHLESQGQHAAVTLLPIGRRSAKVFLFALGVLGVLQNLGVNVTALLTGLGVGGLAIALAAQKTLENLFGGISLAVDQPVRVGDFCKFGDKGGVVEDVGLRSTRVRTMDRTVITIPNADFSNQAIENFALRDKMRIHLTLGLRYETTAEQLRFVLVEVKKLLLAHPRVLDDPARVRFVGFGAYSLDVEVFAYVDTEDFNDFLAVREDVYLRLMDLVEESGSDFAFPSQTTYLERASGLEGERAEDIAGRVRAWREAGELELPDIDPAVMAELDGTLDYPPEGSSARRLAMAAESP